MKGKYDIFISYRRDGGESTAKILRDKLTELGYTVFFDVESLRSGDFNKRLYSVIEECEDVLVVLSPGALDRCVSEDDWVRLEIEHALKTGKNVVPVMLRGFIFPKTLPESIEPLRYKNGLESNYQFFDAFIEKLQEFLTARPRTIRRLGGKRNSVFGAAILLAGILIAACIAALFLFFPGKKRGYPSTRQETNLTDNLLYYVQQNILQIELAAGYMDDAYQACESYLKYFDTTDSTQIQAELEKGRQLLRQLDTGTEMDASLKAGLTDSPFQAADAAALCGHTRDFIENSVDNLYFMEYVTDKDVILDLPVREDILASYRKQLEERLKIIACGVNGLLLPVSNEEALREFKYEFLPRLYYIPLQASSWNADEKTLDSMAENSYLAIEKSMNRIALQIGDSNMERMKQKAELTAKLVEEGMSEKEAEKQAGELSGQSGLLTEKQVALDESRKELEKLYAEARTKFAPLDTDDMDILWGKMKRFLNLGLYEDAISCMNVLRENVRGTDPYAGEYTAAAIRFIRNISRTGIDYGLMVIGFEPGKTAHEQYQIGDVIISVNGGVCRNFEEYEKRKGTIPEGQPYQVVVLRAREDEGGRLEQVEFTLPAGAPKVLMIEMSEKIY